MSSDKISNTVGPLCSDPNPNWFSITAEPIPCAATGNEREARSKVCDNISPSEHSGGCLWAFSAVSRCHGKASVLTTSRLTPSEYCVLHLSLTSGVVRDRGMTGQVQTALQYPSKTAAEQACLIWFRSLPIFTRCAQHVCHTTIAGSMQTSVLKGIRLRLTELHLSLILRIRRKTQITDTLITQFFQTRYNYQLGG